MKLKNIDKNDYKSYKWVVTVRTVHFGENMWGYDFCISPCVITEMPDDYNGNKMCTVIIGRSIEEPELLNTQEDIDWFYKDNFYCIGCSPYDFIDYRTMKSKQDFKDKFELFKDFHDALRFYNDNKEYAKEWVTYNNKIYDDGNKLDTTLKFMYRYSLKK